MNIFKNIFRTRRQNFFIFCMKLDSNKALQDTYVSCSGKLLTTCQGGQKVKFGPKMNIFKNIFGARRQNFFIFCMKLDSNKALQDTYVSCSGKLLTTCQGGQKVKFGPKMNIFKNIFGTRCQNFFIFWMKLTVIRRFKTHMCHVRETLDHLSGGVKRSNLAHK